MQLKGWYIRTGVPLGSKESGGRGEADILGLKYEDGVLHILHIEVGTLPHSADKNLEIIRNKFHKNKEEYILRAMGLDHATWQHRYIATYITQKTIDLIRKKGYKIDKLEDVIQKEILPDIWDWKKSERNMGRKSRLLPTSPSNLWLIKLIEFMAIHGIDLSPYWGRTYLPIKKE